MKPLKITFIVALLLLVAGTVPVSAQTTTWSLDGSTHFRDGSQSSLIGILSGRNFADSQFGMWSYAGLSKDWAELFVGPSLHTTWDGSTYLEGGIGAGVEQDGFTPRFGAYGVIDGGTYSAFGFLEYGEATGWWYLFQGLHKVAGPVSAGVHGQRYVGIGPRIQLDVGPAYIWVARVADPEVAEDPWGTAFGLGVRF